MKIDNIFFKKKTQKTSNIGTLENSYILKIFFSFELFFLRELYICFILA